MHYWFWLGTLAIFLLSSFFISGFELVGFASGAFGFYFDFLGTKYSARAVVALIGTSDEGEERADKKKKLVTPRLIFFSLLLCLKLLAVVVLLYLAIVHWRLPPLALFLGILWALTILFAEEAVRFRRQTP